jgi:spermidine/putrescine-binding protein
MKIKHLVLGGLLLLGTAVTLAACGGGPAASGDSEEVLYFYNWSEYIEPDLFDKFKEETGISVIEDTFSSNEDLLAKLQSGAHGYDVIVPSDYMVSQMIELGMLAELDHNKITDIGDIDPSFADPPFDPGMGHCLPYMWGTTGIGFNWNDWDEAPNSWKYLFEPDLAANFAGRISFLDDARETLGAALIYLGYDPNTIDEAQIEEAKAVIMAIKPYIAAFDSDSYEDNLLSGEFGLVHGWSGDIFTAQLEDENIDYAIPREGAVKWVDNLCITADAGADPARYERALKWIDFLNQPENAGANTNFVWYATPNMNATPYIDQEILDYEAVYPPEEVFAKLHWLEPIGSAIEIYDRAWTEITSQ